MKNLKRLVATAALTCMLGLSAFAGETSAPPCAPPAPGQTETMPCTGQPMTPDDPAAPGQPSAPAASNAGTEYLVTDAAISLFESLLPIF
ncbi:MAG TPA: hypothetical protein VHE60_12095 [Pyrinomonadaceae bacterium]|nr:hypothetical protein [Pyrinomonadaceae bacterium]